MAQIQNKVVDAKFGISSHCTYKSILRAVLFLVALAFIGGCSSHENIIGREKEQQAQKANEQKAQELWKDSSFCSSVAKLEKGMSLNDVKKHFGGTVLVFSGAATCRLAKNQGGVSIKDKLPNGVVYTVDFDKDCKLETWDFRCK
ncbi:MAG: hypothetical protein KKH97_08130 [Proteobacteria bacterium]|nr:hypothetical protein [Pseudomonadota bacterium]